MAGINGSLRTAVDFYLAHQDEAKRSVSIGVLVKEFLAAKTQDAMSRKYLADLRGKLNRFTHGFGEVLVCDLTTSDPETWIRGLNVGALSMESYRRSIGVALEFARRDGYAKTNPAADVKFAKKPTGEVTILTPTELHAFLNHCTPAIIPYVTICSFAGLRPSEAAALDWADVHLDLAQIEVKAKHSKTRTHRLVPISKNLAQWLHPHWQPSGAIGYSRRAFRAAYQSAAIDNWQQDVLRHSYGTHRLLILKSAEALALEMGNSPDIIFRHYRRLRWTPKIGPEDKL